MPVADIYRVTTTTQGIIKRALRLLGVLGTGDSLSADMLEDGREAFNDMLDAWNIEKLAIYVLTRNALTLTGGMNPHTIGPAGGTLDVPRPHRLEQDQAFLSGGTLGTNEVELAVIDREKYGQILDKSLSSIPAELYYEPSMPLGKIWLDPKPDAAYTLILYLEELFAQIASSGTTAEVNLPPGYKEALVYNLAVKLAPEYSRSASPEVVGTAMQAKANLKRLNQRPLTLRGDPALCGESSDSTAQLTGGY